MLSSPTIEILLLLLVVGIWSQIEIPGTMVTLKSVESYLQFKPIIWDASEHQLTVAINFAGRSINGRVITVVGRREISKKMVFEITAKIVDNDLSVAVVNELNKTIVNAEQLIKDISTGEERSLVLELNPKEMLFSVILAKSIKTKLNIDSSIDISVPLDVSIYLGAKELKYSSANFQLSLSDSASLVGCISLVGVYTNEPIEMTIDSFDSDLVDLSCVNPCETLHCNGGVCVNYFSMAICDCFGTERQGESCQFESKHLKLTSEQYFRYDLSENERQPHRIAFEFRPGKNVIEGVLVFAAISTKKHPSYKADLILTLIGNQINLGITDLISIDFTDFPIGQQIKHDVLLKFDYSSNSLEIIIDDESKMGFWRLVDPMDELIFKNGIYFGGSNDEADYGIGFFGCIFQPYIGYKAIMDDWGNPDSNKVTSNGHLDECHEAEDTISEIGDIDDSMDILGKEDEKHDFGREEAEEEESNDWNPGDQQSGGPDRLDESSDSDENHPFDPFGLAAILSNTSDPSGMDAEYFLTICNAFEKLQCLHESRCRKDEWGLAFCDCGKAGYTGRHCQFSNLPKSCQEVFDFGDNEAGPYQVDVDGNGPLRPTFVHCANSVSIVPHNMPNNTEARSLDNEGDKILPLTYKMFTAEHLSHLITISNNCRQYVRYDCDSAPLSFSRRHTWFESVVKNEKIDDNRPLSDMCNCFDKTCHHKDVCRCDTGEIASDQGYVFGSDAGISRIFALQDVDDKSGNFTVGPLECRGNANEHNAATIRSGDVHLMTTIWHGHRLSFWFRTSQSSARIATVNSIDDADEQHLEIALGQGHSVNFRFSLGTGAKKEQSVITVISRLRLNDSTWHRIVVENRQNQLRFVVDRMDRFHQLTNEHGRNFSGILVIGGRQNKETGLIGCIKELEIDGRRFDLLQAVENASNAVYLSPGSQSFCDSYTNPCRNGAECIDDYEARSYYCVCSQPWVHSGRNCEQDVNTDSEVSFTDGKHGFLRYQNFTSVNPLLDPLVFSFRTDQHQALLVYAHDELYNFLQIHLWERGSQLVLTLNNNRTVHRCIIEAEKGKDFGNMDWRQIIVVHSNNRTALYVDQLMCAIEARHHLSKSYITSFLFGQNLLTVDPPMLPLAPRVENLLQYTLLYVGGLPRRETTSTFKRKIGNAPPVGRSRSFYGTELAPILGCIRGFKIGAQTVDLRHGGVRPDNSDAVRIGCETQCESLVCHNNGHCSVAWNNRQPFALDSITCDCSKTSYFGDTCNQESGLYFDGHTVFVFEMAPILDHFFLPTLRKGDDFTFAFSKDVNSNKRAEYLAVLQFRSSVYLEVILNKNGTVNVALIQPNFMAKIWTFFGNYSDGYRHFVQSTFKNADVDYNMGDRFRFSPINYYSNQNPIIYSQYATTIPRSTRLPYRTCSPFRIPGVLPGPQRNVTRPNWAAPFEILPYKRQTINHSSQQEFQLWLLIMLLLLLVIITTIVLFIFCARKRASLNSAKKLRSKIPPNENEDSKLAEEIQIPYDDPDIHLEEMQPLNEKADDYLPTIFKPPPLVCIGIVKPNFDLPPATVHLDKKTQLSHSPTVSRV